MIKRLCASTLAVLMISTFALACTPARKPAPKTTPNTTPKTTQKASPKVAPRATTPSPSAAMPTTSADMHKLATKLAADAQKVPGAKKATVAITGTTAYVGIDLAAGKEGKNTDKVKTEVANKVKKADKRLTNVYVSSDVGVVTRIKRVSSGIAQGKPLSSFTSELTEIGRRITPKPAK